MPAGNPRPEGTYIDAALVHRLIATQFPRWADLPIRPVELDGWDNTTFRLGKDMSVRLPSAEGYTPQVEKEHRWLPKLAPLLPLPVPLAKGVPDEGYPYPWSVYRWIKGEPAAVGCIDDPVEFAKTPAGFLAALYRIDPAGGPPPGRHDFFRGGPLTVYDAGAAGAVWEAAPEAEWHGAPAWLHGDIAAETCSSREAG